jgi:hypothetical protein
MTFLGTRAGKQKPMFKIRKLWVLLLLALKRHLKKCEHCGTYGLANPG